MDGSRLRKTTDLLKRKGKNPIRNDVENAEHELKRVVVVVI
jgi:hypothetical protein